MNAPLPRELAAFALRMVVERIVFRIDAMNERGLPGVSISKGFAEEIVRACRRGSELLENPEPAQAGLTASGGSGGANVSEGVTGDGECVVGDAAGEAEGHLQLPSANDPAAVLPCAVAGEDDDMPDPTASPYYVPYEPGADLTAWTSAALRKIEDRLAKAEGK